MNSSMLDIRNPLFWLTSVVVLVAGSSLLRSHFSPEARERRRREKSHRHVISRKQGPTVKLAVGVGNQRRGGRG
jgi:hypothetical protein